MERSRIIDLGLFFTMFGIYVASRNFIVNEFSSIRLSYINLILSRYQSFIFASILFFTGLIIINKGWKKNEKREENRFR